MEGWRTISLPPLHVVSLAVVIVVALSACTDGGGDASNSSPENGLPEDDSFEYACDFVEVLNQEIIRPASRGDVPEDEELEELRDHIEDAEQRGLNLPSPADEQFVGTVESAQVWVEADWSEGPPQLEPKDHGRSVPDLQHSCTVWEQGELPPEEWPTRPPPGDLPVPGDEDFNSPDISHDVGT